MKMSLRVNFLFLFCVVLTASYWVKLAESKKCKKRGEVQYCDIGKNWQEACTLSSRQLMSANAYLCVSSEGLPKTVTVMETVSETVKQITTSTVTATSVRGTTITSFSKTTITETAFQPTTRVTTKISTSVLISTKTLRLTKTETLPVTNFITINSCTTISGNTIIISPSMTPSPPLLKATNSNRVSTDIFCTAGCSILGALVGVMFLVLVVVIVGWIYTWNTKVRRKRSVGKDSDNAAACRNSTLRAPERNFDNPIYTSESSLNQIEPPTAVYSELGPAQAQHNSGSVTVEQYYETCDGTANTGGIAKEQEVSTVVGNVPGQDEYSKLKHN